MVKHEKYLKKKLTKRGDYDKNGDFFLTQKNNTIDKINLDISLLGVNLSGMSKKITQSKNVLFWD
jgi:hypothetical protein